MVHILPWPPSGGKPDQVSPIRAADPNGTRATVEGVGPSARSVAIVTDRGDRTTLPVSYLDAGHLRHGYAITRHAAQGLTVERALVLGSGAARLQEWGNVAFSRARDVTTVYVTALAGAAESHARSLDARGTTTRLAAALEESSIELLAIDQRPYAVGPLGARWPDIERTRLTDAEHQSLREDRRRARAIAVTGAGVPFK